MNHNLTMNRNKHTKNMLFNNKRKKILYNKTPNIYFYNYIHNFEFWDLFLVQGGHKECDCPWERQWLDQISKLDGLFWTFSSYFDFIYTFSI